MPRRPFGTRAGAGRLLRFLPLAAVAAVLALTYVLGWHEHLSLATLAERRQGLKAAVAADPVLSATAFAILYVAAVAASFPTPSVLTVAGGFLFGWLGGALIAIVAATTGATLLFLATRAVLGGIMTRRAGSAASRMALGFERDAFGYLLVLRLAPFVPFQLVNVAPALCNVRLKTFVAATLIGILPGAFTYAWLGQGLDSVFVAVSSTGRKPEMADLVTPEITVAFAALALVAALAAIVRRVWSRRHPDAAER